MTATITFPSLAAFILQLHRDLTKYSEMIAEVYGKSDRECRDIYLAGLLHDVGKIGIPDSIINKDGRLTDEEFAVIKTHPAIGAGILKKINIAPFISIGAHYHWTCQEMCSRRIPKIMDRQDSGGVMSQPC